MPTLTITLEVELVDLSDEEREQNAKNAGCDIGELGDAGDVDPVELGDMIASHLEYANEEIWAGSNLFAKIDRAACISAHEAEAA